MEDYFSGEAQWLVFDDSPAPSSFMQELRDRRVNYTHSPARLSIGEKRNRLIEKAAGEIIVQFDDDDYYAPHYVSNMVRRLEETQADLIKLAGWFVYSKVYRELGYWDSSLTTGIHFVWTKHAMNVEMEKKIPTSPNNIGYGFSYVFRKSLWESIQFPDVNFDEDGGFAREVIKRNKIELIDDHDGLCLHILHSHNMAKCFPQYRLPHFMIESLFPDIGPFIR